MSPFVSFEYNYTPSCRITIMQPGQPMPQNQMMPVNYQAQMQYSQHQSQAGMRRMPKLIEMLDWRTTVEIIRTYIGVMIVCSLIHYTLIKIYNTVREETNDELVLLLNDLIYYLDVAFIISASIAIIIKTISDIWGAMSYSKIINEEIAEKTIKQKS